MFSLGLAGHGAQPIIDVLSVGSVHRVGFCEAQRATWASHPSVRRFHKVTELNSTPCDDNDNLARWCRSKGNMSTFVMRRYSHGLASQRWIAAKGGRRWVCAQRRQGQAVAQLSRQYQKDLDMGVQLPDYLVIVDDDTMFNMSLFLKRIAGVHPSKPQAFAGCLVAHPATGFAWGGFGLVWSAGALSRLTTRLFCASRGRGFEQRACAAMQADLLHELAHFRPGITLGDLLSHLSLQRPHLCLHSDWLLGYLSNRYLAGDPTPSYHPEGGGPLQSLGGHQPYHASANASIRGCNRDCHKAVACHPLTPVEMLAQWKRAPVEIH